MKDHISTFGRYTQIHLISLENTALTGSVDLSIDGKNLEDNIIVCLSNQDNKAELGFYNCNIVDNQYILTLIPQMNLQATEDSKNQYNAGYPFIFEVTYGRNYGTYKYSQDGSYASFRKLLWNNDVENTTMNVLLDVTLNANEIKLIQIPYELNNIIHISTDFLNLNIGRAGEPLFLTDWGVFEDQPHMLNRYIKNWGGNSVSFKYHVQITGK